MKTLTGVRGLPVSTRVMTVTRDAIGVEMYSTAAMHHRMPLFLRIQLISSL